VCAQYDILAGFLSEQGKGSERRAILITWQVTTTLFNYENAA
jgi:hypothetical protein